MTTETVPVTQADIDEAATQYCGWSRRTIFPEDLEHFKLRWRDVEPMRHRVEAVAAQRIATRELEAHLAEARGLLGKCQKQFVFYAKSHAAKNTKEGDDKAQVNDDFACEIAAFLFRTGGEA